MARIPNPEQKAHQLAAACRDIDTICAAWPDALEAERSRGYGAQSPGPRAAASEVRVDASDPLHVHQMPPANAQGSSFGDPTGNAGIAPAGEAAAWLYDARGVLGLLLRSSGTEVWGERKWTGPFNPPAIIQTLKAAVGDVIEFWPTGTDRVLARLHDLANVARREWPPTPKPGTVVPTPDGTVTVGKRGSVIEMCAECKQVIGGGAADPLRRLDGQPYHLRPCWETARKRKQRSKGSAA